MTAAAMLCALLLAVQAAYVFSTEQGPDAVSYYIVANMVQDGETPYRGFREKSKRLFAEGRIPDDVPYYYRDPPHLAAFLSPFGKAPFATVRLAWVALNVLAMLIGALLLGDALFPRGGPGRMPGVFLPLFVLCFYWPAIRGIWLEQVNGFMFAFVAFAFWCLARERAVGGLTLGAGICMKLIPLPLLLWHGWHGRWRVAVAGVAAIAGLTLLSLAFVPWSVYADYFSEAYALTTANASASAVTPAHLLQRAGAAPAAARAAGVALFVLMGAATVWLCRPFPSPLPSQARQALQAQFASIVALTLSAPAVVYPHTHLLLLIPLCVVARLALARASAPMLGALAGLWLLLLFMYPGTPVLRRLSVGLPDMFSVYTLPAIIFPAACLFLWAWLCVELRRMRRDLANGVPRVL